MKKFILFLMPTLLLLFITSCEKEKGCKDSTAINYSSTAEEDDNSCLYDSTTVESPTISSNLIIGNWKLKSLKNRFDAPREMMDQLIAGFQTMSDEEFKSEFGNIDKPTTYEAWLSLLTEEGIPEPLVMDEEITITFTSTRILMPEEDGTDTIDYTIENNRITLIDGGENLFNNFTHLDIVKLNETELTLEVEVNILQSVMGQANDGITDVNSLKVIMSMSFVRESGEIPGFPSDTLNLNPEDSIAIIKNALKGTWDIDTVEYTYNSDSAIQENFTYYQELSPEQFLEEWGVEKPSSTDDLLNFAKNSIWYNTSNDNFIEFTPNTFRISDEGDLTNFDYRLIDIDRIQFFETGDALTFKYLDIDICTETRLVLSGTMTDEEDASITIRCKRRN